MTNVESTTRFNPNSSEYKVSPKRLIDVTIDGVYVIWDTSPNDVYVTVVGGVRIETTRRDAVIINEGRDIPLNLIDGDIKLTERLGMLIKESSEELGRLDQELHKIKRTHNTYHSIKDGLKELKIVHGLYLNERTCRHCGGLMGLNKINLDRFNDLKDKYPQGYHLNDYCSHEHDYDERKIVGVVYTNGCCYNCRGYEL